MISKQHPILRFFAFTFFVFVLANLLFLNYVIIKHGIDNSVLQIAGESVPKPGVTGSPICEGQACLDEIYKTIYEATASQRLKNEQEAVSVPVAPQSPVTEHVVPFGSGVSTADDWTDVPGLQAYIDSTRYVDIERVVFEASVYIPTGNQRVFVRLFNLTDKHPVWFSEVSHEGGQPQLLISQPVTLDPGNKLYQVQMKTSLKYKAELVQARVKIVVR